MKNILFIIFLLLPFSIYSVNIKIVDKNINVSNFKNKHDKSPLFLSRIISKSKYEKFIRSYKESLITGNIDKEERNTRLELLKSLEYKKNQYLYFKFDSNNIFTYDELEIKDIKIFDDKDNQYLDLFLYLIIKEVLTQSGVVFDVDYENYWFIKLKDSFDTISKSSYPLYLLIEFNNGEYIKFIIK